MSRVCGARWRCSRGWIIRISCVFFSFLFFSRMVSLSSLHPGSVDQEELWRAYAVAWYAPQCHATHRESDTAAELASCTCIVLCSRWWLTSLMFNCNAAHSLVTSTVEVEPQSPPFQSCQIRPFTPRCLMVTALYPTIIHVCTNALASCHEYIVSALRVCNYASHFDFCTMTSFSSGLIDAIPAIVELYKSTSCHDTQSALL